MVLLSKNGEDSMLLAEKTYRFIKDFSSPVLGNVYIGKQLTMSQRQGQKFVEAGLAVELKGKQKEVVADGGRSNTRASESPPSRNAK